MSETVNTDNKLNDKPWLFKKGEDSRRNLNGRPKGSISLKTFAKKYLEELDDEAKIEFLDGLPKDIVWKMAEGNPKQDVDANVEVTKKIISIDE